MIFSPSGLLSFELKQNFGLTKHTFFLYLRIRSSLSKMCWSTSDCLSLPLLKFYNMVTPKAKGISFMYKLLTKPTTNHLSSSSQYWSSLLDQPPTELHWPKALTLPLRLSHCINHWETLQKLFHKWFLPQKG